MVCMGFLHKPPYVIRALARTLHGDEVEALLLDEALGEAGAPGCVVVW